MNNLIQRITGGKNPDLNEFIKIFESSFDLVLQLNHTPQDPEWHVEGNVFIHTQCVLQETYKLLESEAKHLPPEQKLSLVFAAVLHDIGKPLVTKSKEIDGLLRIVAPHHEERGCSYLAYKLLELGIPYNVVQMILRLVAYHHKPRNFVLHNASKGDYFCLARLVNVESLFYLAKADLLGRICKEKRAQLNHIDLFRMFCEEYNVWGKENPYAEWQSFFNTELPHISKESRDALLGYAIQDFESGLIFTPEEAVARRYPYLTSFPNLVVMSGPSGSGKSSWIQTNLKDHQVISLDSLREMHGKQKVNKYNNSFILSDAKEILKKHLRNHEKIVWDATNLRRDFRQMICQLGFNYHALVTLVVLHIPESSIYKGNQSRNHQVAQQVLRNQLDILEWIDDSEAHRIAFVNHEKCLDFRGSCTPNRIALFASTVSP